MTGENLIEPSLECPLCHDAFDRERGLRDHLHEDHDTEELVDQLLLYVLEVDEQGHLA